MKGDESTNVYDEYPYPHLTHSHTHPERIETLATILGMKPAPTDKCRLLEIGCATGFNMFPMAYAFPDSQFTGIDYSCVQIELGTTALEQLGLNNVDLICLDIMDIPADLGKFDYIIAHGVYSWVSEPVRDQLLKVCKDHLASQGVAYMSYNTYPGWHMMSMIREMMLYRARDIKAPMEKAAAARELIEFLYEALDSKDSAYRAYLEQYLDLIRKKQAETRVDSDSLIVHDELEEFNDPVYFYQFVEHASRYGLQYLVESEFADVMPFRFPPKVGEQLQQIARDTVEMEQYLDFLNNRTFRRTLLCHQEIEVDRHLGPGDIYECYMVSRAKIATDKPANTTADLAQFKGHDGAIFTTDHPLTKAAFIYLNQIFPKTASFRELVQASVKAAPLEKGESLTEHSSLMAANFLRAFGYSESLIEIHIHPFGFITDVSEKPEASMIARWQLDHMVKVTNMRHERVELDGLSQGLLRLLDGNRNHEELLELINRSYDEGQIVLDSDDPPAAGTEQASELMDKLIGERLHFFARAALMVG